MQFIPEIKFDLLTIIFLVFCLAILLQIIYLIVIPARLFRKYKNRKGLPSKWPSVSVIICARNEEDHIVKNLPFILEQDYPNFEVIVVNDQSMDDTGEIIKAYKTKYSHLHLINLERNQHRRIGKKLPLTVGIKGSKNDVVLLTDADCKPASNQWMKSMISHYLNTKKMVLGYGPYEKAKGFLNKLIRFDTASIAINYLGFAKSLKPYMGVGRNLSYQKELFFDVEGFKSHYHIQSGDDDLFVQEVGNRKNTTIALDKNSFVYSTPKKSWKAWFSQKQRHFTTAPEYGLINKLLLGIFPMSMFLMLSSFVILLVNYEWWPFVLALFGLRTLLYWIVYGRLFKKLEEKDLRWWFPIMELTHFTIIPFLYYSTNKTRNTKW